MRSRRLVSTLVAAIVGAGLFGVGSVASASSIKRDRPLVLHPKFERVRGSYLVGGGRYVFIAASSSVGHGVLTDGLTGRSRRISSPGCQAFAVGAPWLGFACGEPLGSSYELYNIPRGRFQPFTALAPYANCTRDCLLPIAAIGAEWVAFLAPPGDHHDFPGFEFQSLQTGQVLDDPANAATNINLNAPQLVQSICPPLSLPVVSSAYDSGWGSLTFEDGFAIASGTGGAYLERCGSHLHQFLTYTTPNNFNEFAWCPSPDCPPASNSHEIIWQSAAGRLTGIFLPDRRRFTIHVPATVHPNGGGFANGDMYTLALTPTRLYLLIPHLPEGQIWSIPAATEPSKPARD